LAKQRKDIRDKIDALRLDQNAHNDVRQKVLDQLKQIQDAMKHKVQSFLKTIFWPKMK
jgi:DNA-dependent RNA polymerase auxiliary subunit epsilon